MWAEPGDVAVLTPSRRLRVGAPGNGWFTDRPRPLLLALAAVAAAFIVGYLAVHKLDLGIAAVAGLALVAAVLVRPVIGGLVLVGLVPILSGMQPGVPVSHVRISELLIGVVGVTILVSARRADAVPWAALDSLLLAYGLGWAAFGILDAVTLGQHLTITDWGTVFGQLQFFLIYRGVRTALRTAAERKVALGVALVATIPVALLAALQVFHVGAVERFINRITGGVAGAVLSGSISRATGPFDNWAVLAGYLLPLLLILFALTLAGQTARYRRATWAVGLIALVGFLLAEELSAIVVLIVGTVVLAHQYGFGRRALKFLGIAIIIGGIVAAPYLATRINREFSSTAGSSRPAGVPQTLNFRWRVWSTQYIPAIEARPLTGYGEQLPASIQWQYPESQYIAYLMEGGLPLVALFGALAWAMLRGTRQAARSEDPFERALGRSLTVMIVALLIVNLIWPFMSNAGLPQVLWCLLAIAVPRPARPERSVAPDRSPVALLGGVS